MDELRKCRVCGCDLIPGVTQRYCEANSRDHICAPHARESVRKRIDAYREKYNATMRDVNAKRRAADREGYNAYIRDWCAANRDRARAISRRSSAKRYVKKSGDPS